jgi:hypothetical protein
LQLKKKNNNKKTNKQTNKKPRSGWSTQENNTLKIQSEDETIFSKAQAFRRNTCLYFSEVETKIP